MKTIMQFGTSTLMSLPLGLLSASSGALATNQEGWTEVPIAESSFDLSRVVDSVIERRGDRDVLCLNGEAFVRDVKLANGSIAVDIANDHHRHFANIIFRASSKDTYEAAYLRMHKSGQVDAVQYTPHLNGETNWQLFREAQARTTFGDQDWLTLRVDFLENSASVSLIRDGELEHLLSTNLTLEEQSGLIGVRTLFEGCFSNLRYSTAAPVLSGSTPKLQDEAPEGTLMSWSLSEAFPVDEWKGIHSELLPVAGWIEATAEPNGRLLISRYRRKPSAGAFEQNTLDGVYAGVMLDSEIEQNVSFSFDASDMATVFLNGVALYTVDNSFRAKGPLFRGDFDATRQSLRLQLMKGRNELVVMVAERANGWGIAGSIAAEETVRVSPLHKP